MKNHKGILYDDLMLLSIDNRIIESEKNCNSFKISKYMLLCQNSCYGDFAPILECRTQLSNVTKQELSMMIHLHLT